MSFSNPEWLAGGLIACVLTCWMWRRYDARQHAALAAFVSGHLRGQLTQSLSVGARRTQRGLYLGSVALLFTALAGPLVGYRWEQISRRGIEIVFAIDTSRSMATPDVKPDRLTRAKLAIDDFANLLDGDAVGIVAFAGSAFLVCPVTLDYGAFHESLGAIDTRTIPHGGTNISGAIHETQAALRRRAGSDRVMILVTDGEDLEGDALAAAAAASQRDGLKIYTVGVGSAAGDLIPIPADQGGGFVKDEAGALVRSKLDEPSLKAIAAATGGIYAPLGAQGEGLETVFKAIFGATAKHDLAFRRQKIYIQRYQWPLAASLAFLLVSLLIGTQRRRWLRRAAEGRMAAAALLLMLVVTDRAHADPKKPVVEFNQGTAAYRSGQFTQAVQSFQQSIILAPSSDRRRLSDQEDAYYNLGNSLYRTGEKTEQSNPQETIQKWTEAVKAYETALQLRADDADSRYNRDLVKRKIDALRHDQNQNPKQDPKGGSGGSQGQPPNSPKNAKNNDPKSDEKQPPPPAQPPSQPPPAQPPAAAQPPPAQPPPPAQQPPAQNGGGPSASPPPRSADQPPPDGQHAPGQMSREEASQLLDSAKGEERHALGAPAGVHDPDQPPEKPFKNW